ncbi:MAG: hypothetical protein Q8M03_04810 [Legionella sp.]|nr:hypothetical protein [Legionella sp.]
MKKVLVSLCILGSALMLSSCTVVDTTYGTGYYGTGYSTGYVATTTSVYTAPVYGYGGYGYGYDTNWYAGTPDYYDNSVYVSDW